MTGTAAGRPRHLSSIAGKPCEKSSVPLLMHSAVQNVIKIRFNARRPPIVLCEM